MRITFGFFFRYTVFPLSVVARTGARGTEIEEPGTEVETSWGRGSGVDKNSGRSGSKGGEAEAGTR